MRARDRSVPRDSSIRHGVGELAADEPYYLTDAPGTGDAPIRQVIVFRLRPLDYGHDNVSDRRPLHKVVETVPVEQQMTEHAWVAPTKRATRPSDASKRSCSPTRSISKARRRDLDLPLDALYKVRSRGQSSESGSVQSADSRKSTGMTSPSSRAPATASSAAGR
jgi:hypothetical protein